MILEIQRLFIFSIKRMLLIIMDNNKSKNCMLLLAIKIWFQVTTDIKNACTTDHSGTSASAPLAAGIIALGLQAK